jgi:hypothetical protein
MGQTSRHTALGIMAVAGIAVLGGEIAWPGARAQTISALDARVVAINIPGASAIAQVGTFLSMPAPPCGSPIPSFFPSYIQTGAVLDPNRLLVGSRSNFGAPLAIGVGEEGSFLSIDPTGGNLTVPPHFAESRGQASALGGAVQMFSANSPDFLNGINNGGAKTAQYAGVSNPLGLSNNNAFGRIWPANAPFGDRGVGSSSILDPNGLPLATPPRNAPNPKIGGVYVGSLTNRNAVAFTQPPPGFPQQPQVIPGALNTGAVGTALLGPSPDGTCRAVFAVVTADGAIVQEHTLKGLDGLAPAGTVQSIVGLHWDPPRDIKPRFGVIMNPYTQRPVVRQLFVSEPFSNTIAVINLVIAGTAPNQVFGFQSPVTRISSPALNQPVDLAPAKRDTYDVNLASNTTLDKNSDFYVANHGDNTIVRMRQNGHLVAIRRVYVNGSPLGIDDSLNGIATSPDGSKIYVTFTSPGPAMFHGVLELPAFH